MMKKDKDNEEWDGEFVKDYSSFFMDAALERFAAKMEDEGRSIESRDPNVTKKKSHKKKKKK